MHAEASIYGKISYEKSKKESLIQEIEKNTGNEEKKIEINLNNFKIILPKGVSKFENYEQNLLSVLYKILASINETSSNRSKIKE